MFIRLDKTEIKSLSTVSISEAENAQTLIIDGISSLDLEKELVRFLNLKKIVIKNMMITSLNLAKSTKLEFVNLEGISLGEFEQIILPQSITGLSLVNITITDNKLDLSSYLHLETVRIKNVESSIHFNGEKLKSLFIINCKLKVIPSFIYKQKNLNRLFLNSNQISILDQGLNTLTNVEHLALSDNNIKDSNSMITLKNLKVVELDKNNLSIMPSWIYNQDKLETLSIGNTNITDIPDKLFNLKNISRLDFANLNIDYISNKIQSLQSLNFVNLDGASVVCDDDLYDFLLDVYGYNLFEQRTP
jgi:internalin A